MNKGLNIIDHILLLVGLLVSSHHHLAELVEVHGAGAVLVELLQDALQLLVSEGSQQLWDQAPQGVGGDADDDAVCEDDDDADAYDLGAGPAQDAE